MSSSKDALKKFAQSSKYLKLRDGETLEITFLPPRSGQELDLIRIKRVFAIA